MLDTHMGQYTGFADKELVIRAADGDRDAYCQLALRYRQRLLRVAYGVVGSTEDAEDVVQASLIKVWQKLPLLADRQSFRTWVYRIIVNTALDYLRRQRPRVSLADVEPSSPDKAALHLEREETVRRVRLGIGQLPPNARATLILREYEQLSYKEISAILRIPIGTVMSRLNYARKRLRVILAEDGPWDE